MSRAVPKHIQNILKQRYLKGAEETWADIAARVSTNIASAEKTDKLRATWQQMFYNKINSHVFIPGGRILSEAGGSNQMMNCQTTPVNNSLEEIFNETIYSEMRLYSRSGSSGFDFSKLTPKGTKTNRGYAAGPVAFMGLIGKVAKTIYQESSRDPGSMGILRIDHPDILEFIEAKSVPDDLNKKILYQIQQIVYDELGLSTGDYVGDLSKRIEQILVEKYQFPNFNISVAVTDEYINYYLTAPNAPVIAKHNGSKITLAVTYKELLEKIAGHAWQYGEPGIIFIDTINKYHPLPDEISATNVCGEQPLLDFEGCCLGHINLVRAYKLAGNDWDTFTASLRSLIPTAVRFLDNVIDVTNYATEDYRKIQQRNRKIGLGVMGFADLLLEMGVRYGNNKACMTTINEIGAILKYNSYKASQQLAKEKGYNKVVWNKIKKKNKTRSLLEYENIPRRNTCLNTIAPTGTGALIAKYDDENYTVSNCIEPVFSFRVYRTDETTGEKGHLYNWHPVVQKYIVTSNGGVTSETFEKHKASIHVTALDLSPQEHLMVLTQWQQHIDSSISKTINCPKEITPANILELLLKAHETECKAFTIYRTGSREFEVLKDGSKQVKIAEELKVGDLAEIKKDGPGPIMRTISNEARYGITISIPTGHSKLHVTITEDEDEIPTEVFCNLGKGGTDEASSTEAVGRIISSWLQHTPTLHTSLNALRTVADQLAGIGGFKQIHHEGGLVKSIWDGLSRVLHNYCDLKDPHIEIDEPKKPSTDVSITNIGDYVTCPQCTNSFESVEKCPICPNCGYSSCAG